MPRRDKPDIYDITIMVNPTGNPERKKTAQLPSIHRDNLKRAYEQQPSSLLYSTIEAMVMQIESNE